MMFEGASMRGTKIYCADSFLKFSIFCKIPRLIYSDFEGVVSSLDVERWALHSKRLNPHFRLVESRRWIAHKDGKWVGRIFAQIYNGEVAPVGASRAQFGCLDAIDDADVVDSLVGHAERWLLDRKATVVHGPYSPSVNSESGLLIEGFDAQSMILMPWAPPYLKRHLERLGYSKAKDLISYSYDVAAGGAEASPSIMDRPEWRNRLTIRTIDLRNLGEEIAIMVDLFNDAWRDNWGFVPWTIEEFSSAADVLKHIMPDEGGFIIEIDGNAQAFALVLPNIFEITDGLNGKLIPFGWFKLLWRLKFHKYKSGLLGLFGIRKNLHGTTAGGAVALAFIEECKRRGQASSIERLELGWVLEENLRMRRPIEMFGGKVDTVRRIYGKTLSG